MALPLVSGLIVAYVGRNKYPQAPFGKTLPIITAAVVVATLAVHFTRSYL